MSTKFKISKKSIIEPLRVAYSVINNANLNQTLTGILFVASDSKLELIAINENISCKCVIHDVKVETSGSVLVKGKMISEMIAKIKDGDIDCEVVDNSVLRVSSGTFSADINILDADLFPEVTLEADDTYQKVEVESDFLTNLSNKIIPAADVNSERYTVYSSVLIDSERLDGFIEAIASDNIQLAYLKHPYTGGTKTKIVISASIFKYIKTVLKGQHVSISVKNSSAIIVLGDFTFSCRLVESPYPSAVKAIEAQCDYSAIINKAAFLDAVERGFVVASSENKTPLRLTISSDSLRIASRSIDVGTSYEEVPLSGYSGQNITVTLNARYVANVLKCIEGDNVCLQFSSESKPFTFKQSNDDSYKALIMPLRNY
ncbi:MAG: DNA polymerase III subunit beta [Mycoplasmataceae bacterium]|jgi:DNA polymerase-3 subunit beta|nr:DNA polymerase III subunit beta [Mycoplasmataceae bacterium]